MVVPEQLQEWATYAVQVLTVFPLSPEQKRGFIRACRDAAPLGTDHQLGQVEKSDDVALMWMIDGEQRGLDVAQSKGLISSAMGAPYGLWIDHVAGALQALASSAPVQLDELDRIVVQMGFALPLSGNHYAALLSMYLANSELAESLGDDEPLDMNIRVMARATASDHLEYALNVTSTQTHDEVLSGNVNDKDQKLRIEIAATIAAKGIGDSSLHDAVMQLVEHNEQILLPRLLPRLVLPLAPHVEG